MKFKTIQKIISGITIAATLLSILVFASETPVLISEAPEKAIIVNGQKIEADYLEDGENIMIPVRKVCEALGFTVTWDSETNGVVVEKMPQYCTFNIYEDGYTFARTAPIMLGSKPVVKDCVTYVPVAFAGEIIPCDTKVENGVITITMEDKKDPATVMYLSQTEGMLAVYDALQGEVLVNVPADADPDGIVATLTAGQMLDIVYDEFMTLSLPPITNALKVTLREGEVAEKIEGTVCEVISEEGISQVVIGNKENPMEQTAFNVSGTTNVLGLDGTAIDFTELKEGTKITVVASNMTTMSIPAQRAAYSIRIAE